MQMYHEHATDYSWPPGREGRGGKGEEGVGREGRGGRGRGWKRGEEDGGVRREERVHYTREIWSTSHTIKRNTVAVKYVAGLSTHD